MPRQDEVCGDDIGGGDSPEGVDEHASAESGGGLASSTTRGIEGEARGDAGAEASGEASGDFRPAFVPRAEEEGEEGEESEVVGFRDADMFRMVSIALSRGLPGGRFSRACKEYCMAMKFASSRLLNRQPEAC